MLHEKRAVEMHSSGGGLRGRPIRGLEVQGREIMPRIDLEVHVLGASNSLTF